MPLSRPHAWDTRGRVQDGIHSLMVLFVRRSQESHRFEIYRDGQVLTICVDLGRTSIQFVEVGLIHFLIL